MTALIHFFVLFIRILIVFVFINCSFKFLFSENRSTDLQIFFELINYFIIFYLTISIMRDKFKY